MPTLDPVDSEGYVLTDEQDGTGFHRVPAASLERRDGVDETDDYRVTWVEFRRPGEDKVIHRGVHVDIKRLPAIGSELGQVG